MGGSHKVTVQWKLTWQQSDSLLNPGFAVSVAHYFSITSALKCHHGLVLTKHSWPQQQKQKVIEKKNPAYDTKVKVNSIFCSGM